MKSTEKKNERMCMDLIKICAEHVERKNKLQTNTKKGNILLSTLYSFNRWMIQT